MSDKEAKVIAEKVKEGLKLSYRRLVEKTKKEGGYLVIEKNGKIEKVPAKDL